MKPVPKNIADLLDEIGARLPVILGGNLVGIYLYGSPSTRSGAMSIASS